MWPRKNSYTFYMCVALTLQVALQHPSPQSKEAMRMFSVVLVITAASLLASSSAAKDNEHAVDSKITPDLIQPIGGGESDYRRKRFLRSNKLHDDNSGGERKFTFDKFADLLKDESARSSKFYKWRYKKGYSDKTIYEKLKAEEYPLLLTLFYKYQAYT